MEMTSLVYTIPEAIAAAKLSRTTLYEALRTGQLGARKAGRRTLIPVSELQRYLDSLPCYQAAA